jgi:tripartite-type tricarboxylate transporter receptor subunit TctC
MTKARLITGSVVAIGLVGALAMPAWAQSYPDRPVTLVVPSSAGGGADTVARILADALPPFLGEAVVVENRPGAGGTIGAELVARSEPDGYTWLLIGNAHAANVSLRDNLTYDLLTDFSPVTQVNASPHVVVANPSVPFETIADMVAAAKASPDELNYASAGTGSVTFLAAEIFKDQADVTITHIPYSGGGESLRAIVAGETQIYFSPLLVALPYLEDNRLRALAVTSTERISLLPDVPTVAESGYPDYEFNLWNGLVVPAGTPEEIVAKIRSAVLEAAGTPEVQQRLVDMGATVVGSEPEAFGAFIKSQVESLADLVGKLDLRSQ